MRPIEITIKSTTKEMAEMVNQVAKEAREEALEEVRQMLNTKANMLAKVLQNGYDLWMSTEGRSFDKLHQQRNFVWTRLRLLHDIAGEVLRLETEE